MQVRATAAAPSSLPLRSPAAEKYVTSSLVVCLNLLQRQPYAILPYPDTRLLLAQECKYCPLQCEEHVEIDGFDSDPNRYFLRCSRWKRFSIGFNTARPRATELADFTKTKSSYVCLNLRVTKPDGLYDQLD